MVHICNGVWCIWSGVWCIYVVVCGASGVERTFLCIEGRIATLREESEERLKTTVDRELTQ